MKGIILAGGSGTRLFPITQVSSKQLLPVYDKPMIYYPLSTLILGGIDEIAIISTPEDISNYENLLGDGSSLGIKLFYFVQDKPRGLADAFIVCEDFIDGEKSCLILGDNIFYGNLRLAEFFSDFNKGAKVFGYPVKDPERYGVISFDKDGKVTDILEKPSNPSSNYIVPGLYLYDETVSLRVKNLSSSPRGELEITDLNRTYLLENKLQVQLIGRGVIWLDVGTTDALLEASQFIQSIERIQSYKIGCIEEICLRKGLISQKEIKKLVEVMPKSPYRDYIIRISKEIE